MPTPPPSQPFRTARLRSKTNSGHQPASLSLSAGQGITCPDRHTSNSPIADFYNPYGKQKQSSHGAFSLASPATGFRRRGNLRRPATKEAHEVQQIIGPALAGLRDRPSGRHPALSLPAGNHRLSVTSPAPTATPRAPTAPSRSSLSILNPERSASPQALTRAPS